MTNSSMPQADAELQAALLEQRELLSRAVREENRLLHESLQWLDGYVDPLDAYHDNGQRWDPVAGGGSSAAGGFRSEAELTTARNRCRELALSNEFAINGHENRISYVVGTGHKYRVSALAGAAVPDEQLAAAQRLLDEFVSHNRWYQRQAEIVRRKDRDGEALLRFFLDPQGRTVVRFVEPWQVTAPQDRAASEELSFGVESIADDVEQVAAFWLEDGERVAAEDVQHRKSNVDANVKRGVPLFFPVYKHLQRAEKLLRNMAAVSDIQTAIALIRKHRSGGKSALEQLRGNLAAATTTDSAGTTHYQRFQPGAILDVYQETEYDFPARGLDAGRYVVVLQAILRAVASRLVMPEFMLTSDASNANYSSTLVAEGPAVKMFERLQAEMIAEDKAVMRRVLSDSARTGRLDAALVEQMEVGVEGPRIAVRDRLEEARIDQILVRNGAMSRQTLALRHGLDPQQEQRLLKDEQGRMPDESRVVD